MKRSLVALILVMFVVGLALPAMAIPEPVGDGYHEVYTWDGAWVPLPEFERYCEMYSDRPEGPNQYNFLSAKGTEPCEGPYQAPEAPANPLQKYFVNELRLFPWVKVWINQTNLVWDVFKPGNYMSKAFVLAIQANCPVLMHLGSGTFNIPSGFDPEENKITVEEYEKEDVPKNAFDDKWRTESLLPPPKDELSGTPDDVIDVWWWWIETDAASWTDGHYMTETPPDKGVVVPSPEGGFPEGWVPAPVVNCDWTIIPDSEELHVGTYIAFYEDILVEECDSEGKYIDEFVISICPDP